MMMDFWMDDDEVEIVEQPSKKSEVVAGVRKTSVESEEEIGRRKMKELLARDPIWTGSVRKSCFRTLRWNVRLETDHSTSSSADHEP